MPVHLPDAAGEPYRPSNGTEGEMFACEFCYRCSRYGNDEDGYCDIQIRSFWSDIGEPDYPAEWVFDAEGYPTCTAFTLEDPQPQRCDKTLDMFDHA